jgi:CheY-like chemotaxis protein
MPGCRIVAPVRAWRLQWRHEIIETRADEADRQPTRILVVDDEPHIVDFISLGLRREGYEVRGAADGQQALEAPEAWQPHLVILDLMLPGIDFLPIDAVAGVEGVSSAALQQDLQAGQTLLQVAGAKYSSAADLATALLVNLKHKLDVAASNDRASAAAFGAQYAAILSATETLVTTSNPTIVTEPVKSNAGKQPGAQVNIKLVLINAVAATCNTTVDALQAARGSGISILAACQTTNPSATVKSLSAAILSAVKAQIDAQETAGQITAAEGTQVLANLQTDLPSLLTAVPQQSGDGSAKKG